MLFYNNANTGYGNRVPYWIVGGQVINGQLVWTQPEIALYEWHAAQGENGPGYPVLQFYRSIFNLSGFH